GRVAVAMSGGVDSAVALLKSLPNAIGVTLRLWLDPDGPESERACCSPAAVLSARATCHSLGVTHVTLDLREEFRRAVVDPFVRGHDPEKDQSYMLASLDPAKLDRISFPLGRQIKTETRAEAERAGLEAAGRGESQEACFLAGDDYRSFLERRGLQAQEGALV